MQRRHFLASLSVLPLMAESKPAAAKITRIRLSTLQGRFHKFVAMNAYDRAPKGHTYEHTLVRIETDQGIEGIGPGNSLANPQYVASLKPLIGANVLDLYSMESGRIVGRRPEFASLLAQNRHLDAPLYDIIGKIHQRPAWQLIGDSVRDRVPLYDGTLYFSDVWFKDRGIRAVVEECEEAVKSGFPGVKIKLGRGDRWMEQKAGDERDIAVTHAVREAIGPKVMLMADPNYGYKGRFEAAWRLMYETRADSLYWMEEIFPETPELYAGLRSKMDAAGIGAKLAAGEHMRQIHEFDPYLRPKPLMGVLQLDVRQAGFLDSAELAKIAARNAAILVPHNWASQIGVVMGQHLSRALPSIPMAECDRSTCDVLLVTPDAPGLGIGIDEEVYSRKCKPGEIVIA